MATALPHGPYITAVTDTLTAAGLEPADWWTSDAECRGVYCYLNAVITLQPVAGGELLLIWEWHTGADDGEERGPSWSFAAVKADGSNEFPTGLPVFGYAAPEAVVEAAGKVIAGEVRAGGFASTWGGGIIGGAWDGADELGAGCEAWGKEETADA